MSPGQTGHISRDRWDVCPGQTGHTHTHTHTPRGVPPKFFMFIGFFFPQFIKKNKNNGENHPSRIG